jgi:integrase
MLRIVPRHLKGCGESSEANPCPPKQHPKCPLWIKGYLNGKLIRRSLDTTNWQIAAQRLIQIETAGSVKPLLTPPTVAIAVARFLSAARDRELRKATLKKFGVLLAREPKPGVTSDSFSPSLIMYARTKGLRSLADFSSDVVVEFRQTWRDRGLSKTKKSERLKSFFRYAHESGWIENNPARNLKPPKVDDPGVVGFSDEEMTKIMEACMDDRLKTFLLVMRFSGLAIGDAVQILPDRIEGEHLILRRAKTGKPVKVLLPDVLLARLRSLSLLCGGYYFWNRQSEDSDVQTATGNLRRSLRRVFRAAGVATGHPHQFRHTFVRAHLERDVTLETIADLLGNSVKIVEKHYSTWVPSRQRKLDEAVKRTWDSAELATYCDSKAKFT